MCFWLLCFVRFPSNRVFFSPPGLAPKRLASTELWWVEAWESKGAPGKADASDWTPLMTDRDYVEKCGRRKLRLRPDFSLWSILELIRGSCSFFFGGGVEHLHLMAGGDSFVTLGIKRGQLLFSPEFPFP